MTDPRPISHVQTLAGNWRITLAFNLGADLELHVVILDDGTDPIVEECWIPDGTTLLDDMTEPTRVAACVPRSEGWPDWLETAWVRMGEAA